MAVPDRAVNIWAQLTAKTASDPRKSDSRPESHLYFVGPRQSGKSTCLNKYIFPDRADIPKPTEGLEYTYLRKPAANPTDKKELAHLWELSGNDELSSNLWNTPCILSADQVATAVVAIVVDLSVPSQTAQQAVKWLQAMKAKLQANTVWLDKQGSKLPEQLQQRAKRYIGSSHDDRTTVQHLGISLVLVATKEDTFRDASVEAHTVMAQSLRYIAHMHGASLVYLGGLRSSSASGARDAAQDRAAIANFRSMLNHMLFIGLDKRMKLKMSPQFDPLKPLMIPFGTDRLADIGLAKGMTPMQPSTQAALDQWLAACARTFPADAQPARAQLDMDAEHFAEPEVDTAKQRLEASRVALHRQQSPQKTPQTSSDRAIRRSTGSRKGM